MSPSQTMSTPFIGEMTDADCGGLAADATIKRAVATAKELRRAQEAVLKGIPKLRALVASAPSAYRRDIVHSIRADVRRKLLEYMEGEKAKQNNEKVMEPVAVNGRSTKNRQQLVNDMPHSKRRVLLDGGRTCESFLVASSAAEKSSCQQSPQRQRGGVCMLRSPAGLRFQARIVVAEIAMRSPCMRSEEEAIAVLDKLRELAASCHGSRDQDKLVEAFAGMQAQNCGEELRAALQQLRFIATINARRWVNKMLYSQQVSTLEESIFIHRRLAAARDNGWDALRSEWVECLLARSSTAYGRRVLTPAAAEELVLAAEKRGPRRKPAKVLTTQAVAGARSPRKAHCSNAASMQNRLVEQEAKRVEKLKDRVRQLLVRLGKAMDIITASRTALTSQAALLRGKGAASADRGAAKRRACQDIRCVQRRRLVFRFGTCCEG